MINYRKAQEWGCVRLSEEMKKRKRGRYTEMIGTNSDIYNASWSRRTKAFISSSVVPQINRCRKRRWQKGKKRKIPSDDIWKVAYLSPKQEHTHTHSRQTEIDTTLVCAISHAHIHICHRSDRWYFLSMIILCCCLTVFPRYSFADVWYLFHHLLNSMRKHISHSKIPPGSNSKTNAGSVCRFIMWRVQQATDKDEPRGKTKGHYSIVWTADLLGIIVSTYYIQVNPV